MKNILHKLHFHLFHKKNKYGWVPQKPDLRDIKYAVAKPDVDKLDQLPPSVDLRPNMPPVFDQGRIGSCTANAISGALMYNEKVEGSKDPLTPSRLFIYYNERDMEGTVDQDGGAQIRDGIKSVASTGYANEDTWPYIESNLRIKPPQAAYTDAQQHKALIYMALDNSNLDELKGCLAAGFPFVFGFTVYSFFESRMMAMTGHLRMPSPSDQPMGGHAVLCVGYNDDSKTFLVRNSWSDSWGMHGYFEMPYDYMTSQDMTGDFWTIRKV